MRSGIAGSAAAAALGVVGLVWPPGAAAGTAVLPVSLAEGSFVGLRSVAPGGFGRTGSEIADVGDVNGDGLSDVAIAEPSADPLGRRDAGVVHVVFGGSPLGRIYLRSAGFRVIGPRQGTRMPAPVFQPDGPPAGAMAGSSVAGADDINGDGLDDILIGAPFAGNRGRAFSGSVYVVFGKRTHSGRCDEEAARSHEDGWSKLFDSLERTPGGGSPERIARELACLSKGARRRR